jgi:hypothetical protein
MVKIRLGERTFNLPGNRIARMGLGVGLILAGLVGFLPVLGFWMIPLGLLVLSVDLPSVRRLRRRWVVKFGNWMKRKNPDLAQRMGFNNNNNRSKRPINK